MLECIMESRKPFLGGVIEKYPITKVITNHDYEPYAQKRDEEIKQLLATKKVEFKTYKDQVVYEKSEVVKDDGTPYRVYTPFSKKWLAKMLLEVFQISLLKKLTQSNIYRPASVRTK